MGLLLDHKLVYRISSGTNLDSISILDKYQMKHIKILISTLIRTVTYILMISNLEFLFDELNCIPVLPKI